MDATGITLSAALVTGLAFGAGPCNVTCLPYLGPVFLRGEGIRQSWHILLPFTLGRLAGYSTLGLAAGAAGQTLTALLQSAAAGWILGMAAILIGLKLMRHPSTAMACTKADSQTPIEEQPLAFVESPPVNGTRAPMPGALFSLGAGMALNPCIPLTAVLTAAAATGKATGGLALGLSFGLGAVVIPVFVFGLLIAHFGSELKQQLGRSSKTVEKAGAGLLILLGIATLMGWVQP